MANTTSTAAQQMAAAMTGWTVTAVDDSGRRVEIASGIRRDEARGLVAVYQDCDPIAENLVTGDQFSRPY